MKTRLVAGATIVEDRAGMRNRAKRNTGNPRKRSAIRAAAAAGVIARAIDPDQERRRGRDRDQGTEHHTVLLSLPEAQSSCWVMAPCMHARA